MTERPTIVVPLFQRISSTNRLLDSLLHAYYPAENVQLVLSLDKNCTREVSNLANAFHWPLGKKRIIQHNKIGGLEEHLKFCASLSDEYGSVVIFEDDTLAIPYFYSFACQAIAFYASDNSIAGISLYSLQINRNSGLKRFLPSDNNDVFFLQLVGTWGQVFTKNQWKRFEQWLTGYRQNKSLLPPYFHGYDEDNWEFQFNQYLTETNRFVVYPKLGLSTNFSEVGTHHKSGLNNRFLQSEIRMDSSKTLNLVSLNDSNLCFDCYYEMLPNRLKALCPALPNLDFTVDLFGYKSINSISTDWYLGKKDVLNPIAKWSADLKPMEANLQLNIKGEHLFLGKREQVISKEMSRAERLRDWYSQVPELGIRRTLKLLKESFVERKKIRE